MKNGAYVFDTRTVETMKVVQFLESYSSEEERNTVTGNLSKFSMNVTREIELDFLRHFEAAIRKDVNDIAEIVARYVHLRNSGDAGFMIAELLKITMPRLNALAAWWLIEKLGQSKSELLSIFANMRTVGKLEKDCAEELRFTDMGRVVDWLSGELSIYTARSLALASTTPATTIMNCKKEAENNLYLLLGKLK